MKPELALHLGSFERWALRRSLLLAAAGTLVHLAVFHFRFDHAAHLLAGSGVCLIALSVAWRRGLSGSPAVMLALTGTIGAALVVEIAQPGAVADTADIASAATGAALVAAPWLNGHGSDRFQLRVIAAGATALVLAFVLRYPLWLATEWLR